MPLTVQELTNLFTGAIFRSHIYDPRHPLGGTWDQTNVSLEEAEHYAKAVLRTLEENGLKIVDAKENPI
jgi:hypothetical protein